MSDDFQIKRKLTAILSADAVSYSRMMSENEDQTLHTLADHRRIVDAIIHAHEGRIVNTAGDSVLAEFISCVEAVRCAIEMQEALKTRNDALPTEYRMLFRIGVNLGDVMISGTDLLGDGVNVAARLQSIAEPGGICIASSVYDQISGKINLGFADLGEQNLKNITRPIHVYQLTGTNVPLKYQKNEASGKRGIAWVVASMGFALALLAVAWYVFLPPPPQKTLPTAEPPAQSM
ncbi:MAG: adenylate/guanylate cyclase domain-containing protein, partial [Deltaproteobacteria bacterium]|nr:adenylate/guanylate cyclase domain-containing protein [Deltaproteobacteria bacterium]